MSAFHSVVEEFSELIENHNFLPAKFLWEDHLVSLIRRIKEFTFCYVIIRRDSDGEFRTDLWVAPIDYPDDRLMNHSAAFRIDIGDTYEKDPEFFLKCEKRIINLLGALEQLANASIKELNNPSFLNNRVEFYYHLRKLFEHIHLQYSSNVKTAMKEGNLKGIKKELTKIFPVVIPEIDNNTAGFVSKFDNSLIIDSISPLFYIDLLDQVINIASK